MIMAPTVEIAPAWPTKSTGQWRMRLTRVPLDARGRLFNLRSIPKNATF